MKDEAKSVVNRFTLVKGAMSCVMPCIKSQNLNELYCNNSLTEAEYSGSYKSLEPPI